MTNNQGPWGQSPWGKPGGNQGGGRGTGGGNTPPSPDLDEMLKRAQERLHKLFGTDDGNDGKKGFALIVLASFVLWMASGIYIVKPEEQGVVMRFGQYHRTTSSGLNYHLPYPIEAVLTPRVTSVNRVEVGFRSGGTGRSDHEQGMQAESLMLTGDENIVDITFEVQWKIRTASDFLFNIRNPEDTVKAVAESAMREVIGKSQIASMITGGREEVAVATKQLIQKTLDEYKAGIEIVGVNLRNVNPPEQARAAFLDVQSARVDMETARNQAEAYRNEIVPRARGDAQKLMLDAEGYKQEVIARAQGEASRFSAVYNEYKQSKDVTKKRIYLETMEDILAGMHKIIIDGKGSQGVLPYLPLPDIKKPAEAQP